MQCMYVHRHQFRTLKTREYDFHPKGTDLKNLEKKNILTRLLTSTPPRQNQKIKRSEGVFTKTGYK